MAAPGHSQGGAPSLSGAALPEVPDHACGIVRRASAPAVHFPLARRSDRELFRTLSVHPAPRAGTCGSTEPLSRTARHPGRGAQLGSACEGGNRPLRRGFFPCASLGAFLPIKSFTIVENLVEDFAQ